MTKFLEFLLLHLQVTMKREHLDEFVVYFDLTHILL